MSHLLEAGVLFRAADMLSADDLIMHINAALAQKGGELINERTRVALVAAKATVLGRDRGYRPKGRRSGCCIFSPG